MATAAHKGEGTGMPLPPKYLAPWILIALFLAVPALMAGGALAWVLAVLL